MPKESRVSLIHRATIKASYHEPIEDCPRPSQPTEAEQHYLAAIDLFAQGRICSAWDMVEAGDKWRAPGDHLDWT